MASTTNDHKGLSLRKKLVILFFCWLGLLVLILFDPGGLILSYARRQALSVHTFTPNHFDPLDISWFTVLLFPDAQRVAQTGFPEIPGRAVIYSYDDLNKDSDTYDVLIDGVQTPFPKEYYQFVPRSEAERVAMIDHLNQVIHEWGRDTDYRNVEWKESSVTPGEYVLTMNWKSGDEFKSIYRIQNAQVVPVQFEGITRPNVVVKELGVIVGLYTLVTIAGGIIAVVLFLCRK